MPQVSAAQELQIKAQIRLASLMEEKLVTRISVLSTLLGGGKTTGAVAGVVEIEVGVVSGVFNLESSGVDAPDWRPRHDEH